MRRRGFLATLLGVFGLRVTSVEQGWNWIGDYEGTEIDTGPQLSDYPEVWSEIKKDPPSALYFDIEGLSW